jgi:hypothetical protein
MTREEELRAEIERLQAELREKSPTLMRVRGKAVKIVGSEKIGDTYVTSHRKNGKKYVPIVIVSDE